MSKVVTKRRKAKRKPSAVRKPPPRKPMSDRAVYVGLVIIGLFAVLLGSAFSGYLEYWAIFAVGYLALIAWLVNLYTFHAYRGNHLANWQQSLARIPLRFVGYGTKDGKPLEAAHDRRETFQALIVCAIASVIIVGILAVLALR